MKNQATNSTNPSFTLRQAPKLPKVYLFWHKLKKQLNNYLMQKRIFTQSKRVVLIVLPYTGDLQPSYPYKLPINCAGIARFFCLFEQQARLSAKLGTAVPVDLPEVGSLKNHRFCYRVSAVLYPCCYLHL